MFAGTRGDRDRLYFYFLDRSSREHEKIVIAFIFCFWIDLCRNTRRSCLPFFSDCVDLCSMKLLSDRSLLAHVTGVSALLQYFGWDDQSRYFLVPVSYRCTVSTRSCRWWSLYLTYTRNHSRVVLLLNFGLDSLLVLVNNGSDKPSKYFRSLYLVGRTWEKLKYV